jgi:hypothetical protein
MIPITCITDRKKPIKKQMDGPHANIRAAIKLSFFHAYRNNEKIIPK